MDKGEVTLKTNPSTEVKGSGSQDTLYQEKEGNILFNDAHILFTVTYRKGPLR